MTRQKEHLGLAGEYFITSELLLRDFYTQPTFGRMKKMDLLVVNLNDEKNSTKIIEVKSSQEQKKFPMVKGIPFKPNYFIIFLDYENKTPLEKPDIYILNGIDWFEVLKTRIHNVVEGWRKKEPTKKRKNTEKDDKDRTIWIFKHPDCILHENDEKEYIKYIAEEKLNKALLEIAFIKKSDGTVIWKNPEKSRGIDVPIKLIQKYKVDYDKEWDKLKN